MGKTSISNIIVSPYYAVVQNPLLWSVQVAQLWLRLFMIHPFSTCWFHPIAWLQLPPSPIVGTLLLHHPSWPLLLMVIALSYTLSWYCTITSADINALLLDVIGFALVHL